MNFRIIPRLDIKNNKLIKGINFEGLKIIGEPEQFIEHYYKTGADELILSDAVASLYGINSLNDILKEIVKKISIPISVAGGIRSIDTIRNLMKSGADRVILNTYALENPDFLKKAVRYFGSSSIVVAIDYKRVFLKNKNGNEELFYKVYTQNGNQFTHVNAFEWAEECQKLGAGEILLSSIDCEGLMRGFEKDLTQKVKKSLQIPFLIGGGCGSIADIKDIAQITSCNGVSLASIKKRVEDLHEFNPMLGHRGCRLGISYSEITEMQAQAIIEAAILVQKSGIEVNPEIMVPLVGFPKELELQVGVIHETAKKVFAAKGEKVKYLVGTMIEIPRAALVADEIAKTAQFFSFGTNDLTQTTMGMSRDDSGSFLPNYTELDIIDANPFASVDQSGVGQLMELAVKKGKSSRRGIKLGICGEHGGDPKSVVFCHNIGLNYVSCSPFRVPTARLAAAQAAVS